jgi:hypothetical protein
VLHSLFLWSMPHIRHPHLSRWAFAWLCLWLVIAALLSPVWYDDVCHYLCLQQVIATGQLSFPLQFRVGRMAGAVSDAASQYVTVGPLIHYPAALVLSLVGESILAARFFVALLSLGTAYVIWRWSRRHFRSGSEVWVLLLLAGNVQFVTYGAQYLGEIPALGLLLLGAWLDVEHKGPKRYSAWVAWCGALLVKESLSIPLGAFAVLMCFSRWEGRRNARFYSIGLISSLFLLLFWHWFRLGSMDSVAKFFSARAMYRGEFLALNLVESLRFLIFKPLIWLGMAAMLVRLRFSPRPVDVYLAMLQSVLLGWFLLSAGYDRLGVLLVPIPALYLSEFLRTILAQWASRRWWKQAVVVLLFGFLFIQQTCYRLLVNAWTVTNPTERCMARYLAEAKPAGIYTPDLPLIPFLAEGTLVRIPELPPVGADRLDAWSPEPGEWLVAGEYAFSTYKKHLGWQLRSWRSVHACVGTELEKRNDKPYAAFRPPEIRLLVSSKAVDRIPISLNLQYDECPR